MNGSFHSIITCKSSVNPFPRGPFLIVKIWGANYLKKFPVVFFHEEGGENERFTITESLLARSLANFHHQ